MLGSSEILFQPFCKGTTSSNRFQQEPITSKKTSKFGLFWINRGKLGVQRNWKRNFRWNHSADPWPFLFDFRADLKKTNRKRVLATEKRLFGKPNKRKKRQIDGVWHDTNAEQTQTKKNQKKTKQKKSAGVSSIRASEPSAWHWICVWNLSMKPTVSRRFRCFLLRSSTGFHLILPGFTGFYWILMVFPDLYLVLMFLPGFPYFIHDVI